MLTIKFSPVFHDFCMNANDYTVMWVFHLGHFNSSAIMFKTYFWASLIHSKFCEIDLILWKKNKNKADHSKDLCTDDYFPTFFNGLFRLIAKIFSASWMFNTLVFPLPLVDFQ